MPSAPRNHLTSHPGCCSGSSALCLQDGGSGVDPNRVGGPVNHLLSDGGMSTMIGGAKGVDHGLVGGLGSEVRACCWGCYRPAGIPPLPAVDLLVLFTCPGGLQQVDKGHSAVSLRAVSAAVPGSAAQRNCAPCPMCPPTSPLISLVHLPTLNSRRCATYSACRRGRR